MTVILSPEDAALRRVLIWRAMNGDPARPRDAAGSYSEVRSDVPGGDRHWPGQRCTGMGDALDRIGAWEDAHGRPMLTALVVLAGDLIPAGGFWDGARDRGHVVPAGDERAFWLRELARAITYWSAL